MLSESIAEVGRLEPFSQATITVARLKVALVGKLGAERLDGFVSRYKQILLEEKPRYKTYNHIQRQADSICRELRGFDKSGEVLYSLHQLIMAQLIEHSLRNLVRQTLPRSVIDLYPKQFARILKYIDSKPAGYFDYSNDVFIKDLCLCSFRLIPTGARVAELYGGLPRRVLLSQRPLSRIAHAFLKTITTLKGFRPLLSVHVHTEILEEFNASGHERTFCRWADILAANSQIKGVLGSAWFYDPKVQEMSPHLACVRAIPERNGAFFLKGPADRASLINALSTSKTRRRHHEAGNYIPTRYYMVWPRKALMRWQSSRIRTT